MKNVDFLLAVGCARSGDWASHDLEHELSALYGIAHSGIVKYYEKLTGIEVRRDS